MGNGNGVKDLIT